MGFFQKQEGGMSVSIWNGSHRKSFLFYLPVLLSKFEKMDF